jgi:hypothetical protein
MGMLSTKNCSELKKAGVAGFTLHVDSKQHRPHWKGKTEIELNQLRLYFAEMLAEAGGLSCAFNSTVYGDTLQSVPDIVEWGQKHIEIVHVLVFIAFRAAVMNYLCRKQRGIKWNISTFMQAGELTLRGLKQEKYPTFC